MKISIPLTFPTQCDLIDKCNSNEDVFHRTIKIPLAKKLSANGINIVKGSFRIHQIGDLKKASFVASTTISNNNSLVSI